jgi:hypothetical protein
MQPPHYQRADDRAQPVTSAALAAGNARETTLLASSSHDRRDPPTYGSRRRGTSD